MFFDKPSPLDLADGIIKKKTSQTKPTDIGTFDFLSQIYDIDGVQWYKVFPYSFKIECLDLGDDTNWTYTLPIPPESLLIQPIAASDAVATMGGVVEEPSSIVFWNIQMSGVMAPGVSKAVKEDSGNAEFDPNRHMQNMAKSFRSTISTTGLLTGAISSITEAIDKTATTLDALKNTGKNPDTSMQALIQPHLPYRQSAVDSSNNGYTEIHNLHKFFIFYSKLNSRRDAGSDPIVEKYANAKFGLFFYNYKDNQKYRVILKNFNIIKSAQSPYTYRYQIAFKAWNLEQADEDYKKMAVDRYQNDLKTVSTLSVTSMVGAAKRTLRTLNTAVTDPIGTFVSVPPVI